MTIHYDFLDTPIGRLLVAAGADGLHAIAFDDARQAACIGRGWSRGGAHVADALVQLAEYFAGERHVFDLGRATRGTPFRRAVWDTLVDVPYGQTVSYGELARRIGDPAASRAVGAANGANPWPIVVPCHRVIGANGSLTGFGGGLPTKRWLLDHERRCAPRAPFVLV
jgi:methylated-DNA-[protein]-cysteine S-methyltransferase